MLKRYGETKGNKIIILCTEVKIADISGWSRGISQLKQAGYIDCVPKRISTINLSELQKKLGFQN